MFRKSLVVALLAGAMSVAPARAAQPKPDIEQVGRAVEATLLELGGRDALGAADQPLSIRRPAQIRYELGAVVDVRDATGGVRVMAVTPDSAARRLGLQAGDRLVAVNDATLAGRPDAGERLERALQAGGGSLRLRFARDARMLAASGSADMAVVPAYALTVGGDTAAGRCGYVATGTGELPRSLGVFRAQIAYVDGRSTPQLYQPNRYRLDSGRHVLIVDETIDRTRLTRFQQRSIALMRQRMRGQTYKPLTIDVEPGVTYRIGARLNQGKLDREGIFANEYWEPVVFETRPEPCG